MEKLDCMCSHVAITTTTLNPLQPITYEKAVTVTIAPLEQPFTNEQIVKENILFTQLTIKSTVLFVLQVPPAKTSVPFRTTSVTPT